jgi:serine/threonine protein kinase
LKNVGLEVPHMLSMARDAALGFEYLQQKNFVHRDLAARNVLLDADFKAKIGDFGLSFCSSLISHLSGMARRAYRSEYYAATGSSLTSGSLVLPLRWMAPESYFDGTWDLKSDVWMFGVLIWGLFLS